MSWERLLSLEGGTVGSIACGGGRAGTAFAATLGRRISVHRRRRALGVDRERTDKPVRSGRGRVAGIRAGWRGGRGYGRLRSAYVVRPWGLLGSTRLLGRATNRHACRFLAGLRRGPDVGGRDATRRRFCLPQSGAELERLLPAAWRTPEISALAIAPGASDGGAILAAADTGAPVAVN